MIRYDEPTWPEVAALPRDIPLLIPVGDDPLDTNSAQAAVVLPAFPYGYAGATRHGLPEVRPAVMERALRNLRRGLREDGFQNIRVLHHPSPSSDLQSRISNPPSRVILLATGHTEQHGHHLPLNTDTVIIDAIARGVEAALPDVVTRLPVLPYGVSMHRRQFPGTLNVGGRTFETFLFDCIGWYVRQGYEMFYLINGHGGNHSFLVNVVKYAGNRWPHIFCATSFLHLSDESGWASVEALRESVFPGGMGHACELETSYLLHLRPDLVHMDRAVDETDFISTPNYYMDWLEGGALIANPGWKDDTETGAYGAGSLGTAEKGRAWLEAAIAEKVAHIHEIREQHRRRVEKRGKRGL